MESTGQHQPYVPDEARIPEFNWAAVVIGSLLGIVFGASSLYLVLKVGMTVSASIPVAVLSITLFRVGLEGLRPAAGDDSRKQHRANGGIGRRIDRVRRRGHDAGADDPGFRDGPRPGDGRGGARRAARHLDDDSAAPGVHRPSAWQAEISRGNRLRRRPDRRAGRRRDGSDGLHRLLHRAGLSVSDGRAAALEGGSPSRRISWFKGAVPPIEVESGAAGRRLYHRHAHRRRSWWPAVCWRGW